MFVARGFDEVTIADIAAARGASEKTVWNYFPAKEALLLDGEDATVDAIRRERERRAACRGHAASPRPRAPAHDRPAGG
jgi:AcrR family transcriptional regulator